MGEDMARSNDQDQMRLIGKLRDQVNILCTEFHEHVQDYEEFKLDTMNMQRETLQLHKETNQQLKDLIVETRGIVQIYKDMQGAVRVGIALQKFGKWIIAWPLIITGILAIVDYLGGLNGIAN